MTDRYQVFLSYSRNDGEAAGCLRAQLERFGLSTFKDDASIREGDLWLDRLQEAVDGCGSFVVLVGRDGVRRWIGAETQAALSRYFGPHEERERLPIFPILLGETSPETLPAFLRLFQATRWNGTDALPPRLLEQIRERNIVRNEAARFEGCPFVGLAAFQVDQAQLFFGREKEILDALACFDTRRGDRLVRWLEINGNSGSGKSSLMNAGLLPLVDQGWLWPRTGYEHWRRIGPMMPGEHPVEMLAEHLARTFSAKMAEVCKDLRETDAALRYWLRERKEEDAAFLLAIDQFEELFTFADPDERSRFDRLLATALEDSDCPLFVISTVRADFLDRFEALPRLVAVRNRRARAWTLPLMGPNGLRAVIDGPARLAALDVSEVREAMVAEARDEAGALPLVENALHWLWEPKRREGDRLSGQLLTEQGGLAGILSQSADDLLRGVDRDRALELLFQLVNVDPEGVRHTRRRIPLTEALDIAGGGEPGRSLVDHLAGTRARDGKKDQGPLRLITVTAEGLGSEKRDWVSLIHETLIRSKGVDADGKPQGYWPTLWTYLEQHRERAAWRQRLQADTRIWIENGKRESDIWSHERVREAVAALTRVGPELHLTGDELEFLGPIDAKMMRAELGRPDTPHRVRALIGERLDVLGDPRRGVGVDRDGTPDIEWCAIPGGEVAIQVDRRLLPGTKARRKQVDAFHIARYPVTATQYRAFLRAEDGWQNPQWWVPDLYRDAEGDSYDVGRYGNHPALYVSWFDAMAYCRWLSSRVRFAVRLPDEWEWQQAATGGNAGNVYPWGGDWDPKREPHRANTFESRLGRATAVGMYPDGASLHGAEDMAGTVWEWCLNKFEQPEVIVSSGNDFATRALRGGAWDFNQGYARCAVRNWSLPFSRSNSVGFRVLCSSPIVEP